ncbi:hypothetical protein LUZ60_004198 [Juncus effusus]|nr:hypothetical protein LUZ60_004198 [Juncus effusus]
MDWVTTGAQLIQPLRADPALHNNISMLRDKLSESERLIERCEWWRVKFEDIDKLLPKLKDLEYEAQTLLNEFAYQESKEKVERQNRSFAGQLISSSHTNFRNWWTGYATKVKEVHEKLERVYGILKVACDGNGVPENPKQFSRTARPETSSFIAEPKVFGRDKELDEVMRLLGVPSRGNNATRSTKIAKKRKGVDLAESSGVKKTENVSVIPIVGIGGVGKTTLAQMVFNNKMVESHFELLIWVCVSENFDVPRLTEEIHFCATKQKWDGNNLNSLQGTLKEALESKRFLLVLDDIWNENKTYWNNLIIPMKEGCEGSRVIITTRSHKVAEITGTVSMGPVLLKGLEQGVYWEFFKSCAFGRETNSVNYPELMDIGKKIVDRLKGSPLAAKTLGSLLSTNLDEWHWRNIRDSEMWELQQGEDGILPVLQLSYQYLPFHLKKCFSFCSLYPKDYELRESELTKFWTSLGLITPEENLRAEVVAKGYIHELVSRCFFQKAEYFSDGWYVIHDLMHDVAQSITKDECFRIENDDFEQKISTDIRHLSIFKKLKQKQLKGLCRYKKLQSLIIYGANVYVKAIERWCNELPNICYLSLAACKIKNLPENIGNLKHLRSLNTSSAAFAQLPDSFCNLYNLEYLYMDECYELERFPGNSNRLISLKLLRFSKIPLVGHIPNLANATQLDGLNFYGEYPVEMLKHVTGIYGKMDMHLDNVTTKREAEQAQMKNKKFVHSLKLQWSGDTSTSTNVQEEVLAGLCPHPNLKELDIECYAGTVLPSWLETAILTNLTKLTIYKCSRLTSLENCLVASNLPVLKEISLMWCEELVLVPLENFSGFVNLEQLTIHNCPKLTCPREPVLPPSIQKLSLVSSSNLVESLSCSLQNLTSLTFLSIRSCPNLRCLRNMALPPSIRQLYLDSCGNLVESLSHCLQNLTSLTVLSISSCPNLRCPRNMALPPSLQELRLSSCNGEVEEWLFSSLQNLISLTKLSISGCPGITSIPVRVTSNLKSLEDLDVSQCNELQSIGGNKFLESIKWIFITGCPKLQETKGNDRRGKGKRCGR